MYVRRHVVVIITQMVFLEELCSFSTNSGIRLVLKDYNFISVHADNVLVSLKFGYSKEHHLSKECFRNKLWTVCCVFF